MISRLYAASAARRRQVDLLAQLLEQGQARVFLELDLRRHGRLRQVQLFGGARKAQVARHGFEHLQLAQRGVVHGLPINVRLWKPSNTFTFIDGSRRLDDLDSRKRSIPCKPDSKRNRASDTALRLEELGLDLHWDGDRQAVRALTSRRDSRTCCARMTRTSWSAPIDEAPSAAALRLHADPPRTNPRISANLTAVKRKLARCRTVSIAVARCTSLSDAHSTRGDNAMNTRHQIPSAVAGAQGVAAVAMRTRRARGVGTHEAGGIRGAGRHRRRRRPDGAPDPGHRRQAQPDEAAAGRRQQVRRRRRRGLPRREGRQGRPAQDRHHAVQPVHHAAGHRRAVQLEGHDAGGDDGARPVRAVGQRRDAVQDAPRNTSTR